MLQIISFQQNPAICLFCVIEQKLSLNQLMAIAMLRKKDPGLLKHMADKIMSTNWQLNTQTGW